MNLTSISDQNYSRGSSMDLSITDFIKTYYDVMFTGDGVQSSSNYEEVEEFLLADEHSMVGYVAVNSLFINTFSNAKHRVLAESVPSMQQIQPQEHALTAHITTAVSVFGWDDLLENMFDSEEMVQNIKLSAIIRAKMEVLKHQYLNCSDTEIQKKELFDKIVQSACDLRNVDTPDYFTMGQVSAETFQARTDCMIQSLGKAKKVSQKTFLIAGGAHLYKNACPNHPVYFDWESVLLNPPIDGFITFLQPRNVVVLKPKKEKVLELGRAHVLLDTSIQRELQKLEDAGLCKRRVRFM